MSVRFDLTAITPQLMDAVIYMDNSPSYAAFKEEIEAILSDFNATGHLSSSWKINEQELTEKTERLSVLNGLLNVDKKQNEIVDGEIDEVEPPARKDKEWER